MVHTAALTVILLHGGAWYFGSPAGMEQYRPALPRQAKVVNLDYPLGDYRRGLAAAERVAARERASGRRVLAVGLSAGGGYAAALAAKREVDAAVALAPVLDYPTWGTWLSWYVVNVRSMAERRRLAPTRLFGRKSAPVRIVLGTRDNTVPAPVTRRFARRWPQVRLRMAPGETHELSAAAAAPTIASTIRADLRDFRRVR